MSMADITSTGGWRVRVEQSGFTVRTDFYVWRACKGYTEHMGSDGLAMLVAEGCLIDVKPTFTLQGFEIRTVMNALAEALAEQGVKTPNDHMLQGQLDAQTAHLNDLRTLLKLDRGQK